MDSNFCNLRDPHQYLQVLESFGIDTPRKLFLTVPLELSCILGVDERTTKHFLAGIYQEVGEPLEPVKFSSSLCKSYPLFPNGPVLSPFKVQSSIITEIAGGPGAGKTNLLIQLAASRNVSCIYVDSEQSFSFKRFQEFKGDASTTEVLSIISKADFTDFLDKLDEILLARSLDILIIDSITVLARQSSDVTEQNDFLMGVAARLMELADLYNIAVVVSNQVAGDKYTPALGLSWSYVAKTKFLLVDREIRLLGTKDVSKFKISENGVAACRKQS